MADNVDFVLEEITAGNWSSLNKREASISIIFVRIQYSSTFTSSPANMASQPLRKLCLTFAINTLVKRRHGDFVGQRELADQLGLHITGEDFKKAGDTLKDMQSKYNTLFSSIIITNLNGF